MADERALCDRFVAEDSACDLMDRLHLARSTSMRLALKNKVWIDRAEAAEAEVERLRAGLRELRDRTDGPLMRAECAALLGDDDGR